MTQYYNIYNIMSTLLNIFCDMNISIMYLYVLVHVMTESFFCYIQARVLYDFEGDQENGEVVVKENAEIQVLNRVRIY